ncbi:hypothetical protein GEMRC1_006675 [Eukaryota sp. GEM-RC1]
MFLPTKKHKPINLSGKGSKKPLSLSSARCDRIRRQELSATQCLERSFLRHVSHYQYLSSLTHSISIISPSSLPVAFHIASHLSPYKPFPKDIIHTTLYYLISHDIPLSTLSRSSFCRHRFILNALSSGKEVSFPTLSRSMLSYLNDNISDLNVLELPFVNHHLRARIFQNLAFFNTLDFSKFHSLIDYYCSNLNLLNHPISTSSFFIHCFPLILKKSVELQSLPKLDCSSFLNFLALTNTSSLELSTSSSSFLSWGFVFSQISCCDNNTQTLLKLMRQKLTLPLDIFSSVLIDDVMVQRRLVSVFRESTRFVVNKTRETNNFRILETYFEVLASLSDSDLVCHALSQNFEIFSFFHLFSNKFSLYTISNFFIFLFSNQLSLVQQLDESVIVSVYQKLMSLAVELCLSKSDFTQIFLKISSCVRFFVDEFSDLADKYPPMCMYNITLKQGISTVFKDILNFQGNLDVEDSDSQSRYISILKLAPFLVPFSLRLNALLDSIGKKQRSRIDSRRIDVERTNTLSSSMSSLFNLWSASPILSLSPSLYCLLQQWSSRGGFRPRRVEQRVRFSPTARLYG